MHIANEHRACMCTVGSISDSEPQGNTIMDLWRLPLSDPLSSRAETKVFFPFKKRRNGRAKLIIGMDDGSVPVQDLGEYAMFSGRVCVLQLDARPCEGAESFPDHFAWRCPHLSVRHWPIHCPRTKIQTTWFLHALRRITGGG